MRSSNKDSSEKGIEQAKAEPIWLDEDEPAAFELINAKGSNELILIADHASNRVPRCLHQLGLSDQLLSSHIAWDAGTADLARHLSKLLDAPLLLSNYSRLVIDCNRAAHSAEAILEVSDGTQIPGNFDLSAEHIESRVQTIYGPYHNAIESFLEARKGKNTSILSIHSFSPELQGKKRPWSIGVCYGDDSRLARAMLPWLTELVPGPVGDNQPYSIEDNIDYSLPHHAGSRGLLQVMLEVRRDKIESSEDAFQFALLIQTAWLAAVKQLHAC